MKRIYFQLTLLAGTAAGAVFACDSSGGNETPTGPIVIGAGGSTTSAGGGKGTTGGNAAGGVPTNAGSGGNAPAAGGVTATGGTAATGGTPSTGGNSSVSGGAAGAAGQPAAGGTGGSAPLPACSQPNQSGCFENCVPNQSTHFLNQCGGTCFAFNNSERLPQYNAGVLPPLP